MDTNKILQEMMLYNSINIQEEETDSTSYLDNFKSTIDIDILETLPFVGGVGAALGLFGHLIYKQSSRKKEIQGLFLSRFEKKYKVDKKATYNFINMFVSVPFRQWGPKHHDACDIFINSIKEKNKDKEFKNELLKLKQNLINNKSKLITDKPEYNSKDELIETIDYITSNKL